MTVQFVIPDESLEKKSAELNDTDKKNVSDSGPDPSAPITRKGVLTSFLTGKPMEIPEHDIVIQFLLVYHVTFVCELFVTS